MFRKVLSSVKSAGTSVATRSAQAVTAVGVLAFSVAASAQEAPEYMTDLEGKLTEVQTVMAFFIGAAVIWAGYKMIRRAIR